MKAVSGTMTVERLQLQASDAVENGASSIASIVVSSSALTFNGVTFQAGAGAQGQQGASPAPESGPAAAGGIGGFWIDDDCKAGVTTGYCSSVAHGAEEFLIDHGMRLPKYARALWGVTLPE